MGILRTGFEPGAFLALVLRKTETDETDHMTHFHYDQATNMANSNIKKHATIPTLKQSLNLALNSAAKFFKPTNCHTRCSHFSVKIVNDLPWCSVFMIWSAAKAAKQFTCCTKEQSCHVMPQILVSLFYVSLQEVKRFSLCVSDANHTCCLLHWGEKSKSVWKATEEHVFSEAFFVTT